MGLLSPPFSYFERLSCPQRGPCAARRTIAAKIGIGMNRFLMNRFFMTWVPSGRCGSVDLGPNAAGHRQVLRFQQEDHPLSLHLESRV